MINSKYAKAYIKDQLNLSNNGPYKIKSNLLNLGIKEDVVDELLFEIDNNVIKDKLTKLINKQLKIKKNSKNESQGVETLTLVFSW